ncbi:hypothetical protein CP02DC21_1118, partial [Chlamydia psittaci 02DC21]
SMSSSHRVPPFCSCSYFLTLFWWNLQSDIWVAWTSTVRKEIPSDKN